MPKSSIKLKYPKFSSNPNNLEHPWIVAQKAYGLNFVKMKAEIIKEINKNLKLKKTKNKQKRN